MTRLAFFAKSYNDSDFCSGGVKLNYLLAVELQKLGYHIDWFVNRVAFNSYKQFEVFELSKFDEHKQNYDLTISGIPEVVSDIVYVHDHSYLYRQEKMSNKFSHFFYRIFNFKKHKKRLEQYNKTKNAICKTNLVVSSSQVLKDDIVQNYGVNPVKLEIIPPPIENYEIKERKTNDIKVFGISTVGFVRKGGYLTLKAIRELKGKYNFKVKFIYPSSNFLVKFLVWLYGIKDYCEFVPTYKNMAEFYYSIDCLLMPSLIEPFGMVTTEALSTGCPVITGKHCGAADCIENGQNGFLYDGNKSYKNLAKTIEKMIVLDKDDLKQMQINARKSAQNMYLKDFVQKYEVLIKKLIK